MAYTVGMVSLGCPKNQMDAELMLGKLRASGIEIKADPALADVVIVNTCGFIEDAKRESIEQILELAQLKKEGQIRKIIVTGCMAERYGEEVAEQLPECDAVIGLGANGDIVETVRRAMEGERVVQFPDKACWSMEGERLLLTPPFFAYLRIGDGCDNRCTYCAIPMIRGGMKSRPQEAIVEEARQLVKNGAREIVLVAQDTTLYGKDLYGESRLPELLTALCEIEDLRWIRMLYCYPEHITDRLLAVIAREPKIVKYLDIPIQHASGSVLRRMRRHGDAAVLTELIRHIREVVPHIVLRTTVMTGFPGETEEDFTTLCEFLDDVKFERLGCFAYSAEEGTPAAKLPDQIDEDEKHRRADIVTEQQARRTELYQQTWIGKTVEVLVESYDRYAESWFGRTYADAPEIDGKVFFSAPRGRVHSGDFVRVHITDAMDWDLIGEVE